MVLDRVNKVAFCALSQRADSSVLEEWCNRLGYKVCRALACRAPLISGGPPPSPAVHALHPPQNEPPASPFTHRGAT